jgi:hypothetical protein
VGLVAPSWAPGRHARPAGHLGEIESSPACAACVHLCLCRPRLERVRRSFVKGLSRIFDLSIEPTALLQPIQNLERSIFRDCASLENSAGKLSESNAEISCSAGLCFADSVLLKKVFPAADRQISFIS